MILNKSTQTHDRFSLFGHSMHTKNFVQTLILLIKPREKRIEIRRHNILHFNRILQFLIRSESQMWLPLNVDIQVLFLFTLPHDLFVTDGFQLYSQLMQQNTSEIFVVDFVFFQLYFYFWVFLEREKKIQKKTSINFHLQFIIQCCIS